MGLDVSHDAFHGAYSAFNRLRQAVAWAAGGSFPPHTEPKQIERLKACGLRPPSNPYAGAWDEDFNPEPPEGEARPGWFVLPDGVDRESHPGLYEFLGHSDCDGEISAEMCPRVADDLEPLIVLVDEYAPAVGHIERGGGFAAVLRGFVDGCCRAAAAGEPLTFH